jgi:spore maturation protein CgeB
MSLEDMVRKYQRAKIVISDSAPDQMKGRSYHGAACGAMIMETEHSYFKNHFIPGVEFVPYEGDNAVDLANKIEYYIKNEDERQAIAKAGYEKFRNNYTGRHYWEQLLELIPE